MFKVMIVDDEVQIRKGLKMKLNWEQEGFSIVAEASDGKEALALLDQFDIDLVITDIRMPFMNGIDFFTQCHHNYPTIKIIVLSGYSDFDYAKAALKAGVKDYLLKPVAPKELMDILGKIRKEIEKEKTEESENSRIHFEKKESDSSSSRAVLITTSKRRLGRSIGRTGATKTIAIISSYSGKY